MVTTRSKTARTQTQIDDFTEQKPPANKDSAQKSSEPAPSSRKRKAPPSPEPSPAKKLKTSPPAEKKKDASSKETNEIIINRAPVLQLWAACVTHAIHPQLSWATCLSAGSAVSTICAVAKGRSIGTIEEKDPAKKEKEKKEERAGSEELRPEEEERIKVMQFELRVRDGLVWVGSGDKKGKPPGEEGLRRKFGEGEFERVREVFGECAEGWKGHEEELNEQAFHFYEGFRPSVQKGQKGWGRKGKLDLGKVREVTALKK